MLAATQSQCRRNILFFLCVLIPLPCGLLGQTQAEIRQAFIEIRDDHVRNNCCRATYWLYTKREALRDQVLEELYRTNDAQARDALLFVLISTDSLNLDERFARFLVQRLRSGDLQINIGFPDNASAATKLQLSGRGDPVWKFINAHYTDFEPLLKSDISSTDNMSELWATAWLMKKRGVLSENVSLFDETVLRKAGSNLKADEKGYNASQAARFFLIFPSQSLPLLKELVQSSDSQQRSLARALIDAISKGSRDAFGFINSKCTLAYVPFGDSVPDPDWLYDVTQKYIEQETYP